MDTILVVNAGSSSVKFQVFAIEAPTGARSVCSRDKWTASARGRGCARAAPGRSLVDQSYPIGDVADVPAAMKVAGCWLRDEHQINPIAVGHRVVHGGPEYDRPILVDDGVLARLERYVPLAPLHQPNNLAPIRTLLEQLPGLPQVACFDTAFHRDHDAVADHYAIPQQLHAEGVRRYGFHGLSYEYIAQASAAVAPEIAGRAGDRRPSRQRRFDVRAHGGAASKARWVSPRSTGCRWERGPASSIPAWCSI